MTQPGDGSNLLAGDLPTFAMAFYSSTRLPHHRIAVDSFIVEYNNRVDVLSFDEETQPGDGSHQAHVPAHLTHLTASIHSNATPALATVTPFVPQHDSDVEPDYPPTTRSKSAPPSTRSSFPAPLLVPATAAPAVSPPPPSTPAPSNSPSPPAAANGPPPSPGSSPSPPPPSGSTPSPPATGGSPPPPSSSNTPSPPSSSTTPSPPSSATPSPPSSTTPSPPSSSSST